MNDLLTLICSEDESQSTQQAGSGRDESSNETPQQIRMKIQHLKEQQQQELAEYHLQHPKQPQPQQQEQPQPPTKESSTKKLPSVSSPSRYNVTKSLPSLPSPPPFPLYRSPSAPKMSGDNDNDDDNDNKKKKKKKNSDSAVNDDEEVTNVKKKNKGKGNEASSNNNDPHEDEIGKLEKSESVPLLDTSRKFKTHIKPKLNVGKMKSAVDLCKCRGLFFFNICYIVNVTTKNSYPNAKTNFLSSGSDTNALRIFNVPSVSGRFTTCKNQQPPKHRSLHDAYLS